MSRYSRYPYQSSAGQSNAHAPVSTSHVQALQLRNPWAAPIDCRESVSTNSSSTSSRRGGAPGFPPLWLHPVELNHNPQPRIQHHYSNLDHPIDVIGPTSSLLPPPLHQHHQPVPITIPSRPSSDRDRPATPASSPGSGGGGAVDGCGGHCVAFENFCYYCLQVVFVIGVLCGVALTIAGAVLRQGRGRDLVVLVYIGCLLALVCTVLLGVQCCVRRNVKRRKRALRERRSRGVAVPVGADAVPLQDLNAVETTVEATVPTATSQYQPLLVRLVQQHAASSATMSTNSHRLQHSHPHHYRPGSLMSDQLDTSRSGTPWWRRRSELKPTIVEMQH